MDTRDIKGLLASLKSYATGVLEYDKVAVKCQIRERDYEIEVNCDDTFQAKGRWEDKVEQAIISENFDWETSLEDAGRDIFARLEKIMKRPERELRYGLNLIGQSIEAAQSYKTHVGMEFLASMKREQEKTMLMLPDRTGGSQNEPEPESESIPQPQSGPTEKLELDDEVPF